MTYRGRVKNGVIVLDDSAALPDGTEVQIEPVNGGDEEGPTLAERLQNVIGIAEGLPPDMAGNHDHYIHGAPRKP